MEIAAACDALATELRSLEGGVPRYFEEHRARFAHDLGQLARWHRGGRILELGAHPGYLTWLLARTGREPLSVDLDPARAASLYESAGVPVARCDIERERLPMESGSVGTVLLLEVFEHLRVDPPHVLSEIHRVLAAGGTLLLETPNLYSLGNLARFVSGRGIFPFAPDEFAKLRTIGHMGHVREYTRRELHGFLVEAGFTVEHEAFVVHRASRSGRFTDLMYRLWPRSRPYQFVVARRGSLP